MSEQEMTYGSDWIQMGTTRWVVTDRHRASFAERVAVFRRICSLRSEGLWKHRVLLWLAFREHFLRLNPEVCRYERTETKP